MFFPTKTLVSLSIGSEFNPRVDLRIVVSLGNVVLKNFQRPTAMYAGGNEVSMKYRVLQNKFERKLFWLLPQRFSRDQRTMIPS